MLVTPKYAPAVAAPDTEKTQFPGVRSAISGHRYYSPWLGRFVCRDPKEEDGGRNLYAFLHNNAINHYDYLGWETYAGYEGPEGRNWYSSNDPGDGVMFTTYQYYSASGQNVTQQVEQVQWQIQHDSDFLETSGIKDVGGGVSFNVSVGSVGGTTRSLTVANTKDQVLFGAALDEATGLWLNTGPGLDVSRNQLEEFNAPNSVQMSEDGYYPDLKHGGPHIDRRTKDGKTVGRYREDGSKLPHMGKNIPNVPNSDKKKFNEAAEKLRKMGPGARAGLVVGGTVALIWLIGNDITGVGVGDDWAVPAAGAAVWLGITGERKPTPPLRGQSPQVD